MSLLPESVATLQARAADATMPALVTAKDTDRLHYSTSQLRRYSRLGTIVEIIVHTAHRVAARLRAIKERGTKSEDLQSNSQ